MTLLPIVERELRVAARRRGTYWSRAVVAVGAIVLGGFTYVAKLGVDERELGKDIFLGLAILSLLYALLAGRRFTADCLSEEKREGTLGLLFLTDLKGYDVVLGKMVATSLSGFYGMLGLFPVLAVPLLMGGVTNAELWRVVLVLVDTFLFSLAVGIFASSVSRDARRAVGATIGLTLAISAGPALCALASQGFSPVNNLVEEALYSCPANPFVLSFDSQYVAHPRDYWWSVGVIHALTWALVLLASLIAPRSWQDQPQPTGRSGWRAFWRRCSYGHPAKQHAFRKRLLDANAFYWLAARARLKPGHVWLFLAATAGWYGVVVGASGDFRWSEVPVCITLALILNSTLKLWVAVEAGQRLAEDQKVGAMELLLSTPLTVREILRGQFLALRRQFFWPILVVIGVVLIAAWHTGNDPDFNRREVLVGWLAGALLLAGDATASSWVAMAAALTARSSNRATATTIVRIMVLPWIVFGAVAAVANVWSALGMSPPLDWRFYVGWWFGLGLAADLGFGLAARHQLLTRFRTLATQRFAAGAPRRAGG